MLLAVDVGNTETKLGFFTAREAEGEWVLSRTWRVTTARQRTYDEFGVLLSALFRRAEIPVEEVRAIVISSVVPQNDRALAQACRLYFNCEPHFFTAASQSILPVRTERPKELGADLAAAAIAASARYGAPSIVVGLGTATTFGVIGPDGAYLGAAIAPGIQTSIDALIRRTAKLPHVPLDLPPSVIGADTVTALQSGILYGFVGQIEGMIARIERELGSSANVVATGGFADLIARHTESIAHVEPHLVLLGLCRYAEISGRLETPMVGK